MRCSHSASPEVVPDSVSTLLPKAARWGSGRVQELLDRVSRQFRGGRGGSRRESRRVRTVEVHFVAVGLDRISRFLSLLVALLVLL